MVRIIAIVARLLRSTPPGNAKNERISRNETARKMNVYKFPGNTTSLTVAVLFIPEGVSRLFLSFSLNRFELRNKAQTLRVSKQSLSLTLCYARYVVSAENVGNHRRNSDI